MRMIERIIDLFVIVDIGLNFLKRTRAHKDIKEIAWNYIYSLVIFFDVLGAVPFFFNESIDEYWYKCFRIIHFFRFTKPLELLL